MVECAFFCDAKRRGITRKVNPRKQITTQYLENDADSSDEYFAGFRTT